MRGNFHQTDGFSENVCAHINFVLVVACIMHKFSILHTDACIGRLSGGNHVPSVLRVSEQSESLLKVYILWSGIRVAMLDRHAYNAN